ncbi:hypothetical protein WK03_11045 [Burkholderia cepacia]|nr:hypothetical protein WK03_11045 [Burkholderia cepacia]
MTMTNRTTKYLSAAAFLIASGAAFAAPTTFDIKVAGKILPGSCSPNLSSWSTVTVNPNLTTLSVDKETELTPQSLDITIDCGSALSRIALVASDVKTGTAYAPGESRVAFGDNTKSAYNYGLGLGRNNNPIGAFQFRFEGFTADSTAVVPIYSTDGGKDWSADNSDGAMGLDPQGQKYLSWAKPSSSDPVAASKFVGKVTVVPFIAPKSTLDTSQEIDLDGHAVVTIRYL